MSALLDYLAALRGSVLDEVSGGQIPPMSKLTGARSDHLAIAVCLGDGEVMSVGTRHEFAIQSISKAFGYAAALDHRGEDHVLNRVDVEPTGEVFNAVSLNLDTGRPKNPLINIGAIRIHAMLGTSPRERRERLHEAMCRAAGRDLEVHADTLEAEMEDADRNLALAHMLRAAGQMAEDAHDVVEGYVRGCSTLVTAEDLSVMAATLSSGGVNPKTGERVFSRRAAKLTMSVMMTCGMYDDAGDWMTDVGLPAKSGVGGGILAALPPKLGFATFSPSLDEHGNPVRGTACFDRMSRDFALHMLDGASVVDAEARAEDLLRRR
ncbi:glutaminase A [Helcobacillus massiliensis]|uniref:Glutaminase n=1 Tax=Helcobacillus massiliensis TaxID=521392 RepID=A0A839QRE7_9MICO|nr:glutaminase A [Helcobacillus massiliensis]MBB3022238.1 glutaminase [Helcobacillus massiliensis]MDK7742216.1 glutaminase A [Helcobacillus massiliensis]WOO93768.1 glutaminase A [Helcobacillus massiliensis]